MNRNAEHASGERFDKSDRSARLLRTLKYVEGAGEAGIRPEDLARFITTFRPGDQVSVEVLRDGEIEDLELTLGKRPDDPGV